MSVLIIVVIVLPSKCTDGNPCLSEQVELNDAKNCWQAEHRSAQTCQCSSLELISGHSGLHRQM